MNNAKHYFAFISHSTCDEKVALWLRDKLETYNIPTSVQNEVGIEYKGIKKLKPCFVYQTDLAGSDLNKALQRELTDSQFLIVICSRNSACSEYVNDEIKHFLEGNSPEKIIPYIIDGEPFAKNDVDECFTPALRELAERNGDDAQEEKIELRGINAKKLEKDLQDKKAPIVNVIATMLGVRFDLLWNRYRRKLKRKRICIGAAACFAILLGLFYWDYTRPSYHYYVDYVDRLGVPEGVIELQKEQVSHRSGTYQFEYRRIPFGQPHSYSWRVAKVRYVNAALRPKGIDNTELKDRFPIQEIEYNKSTGIVQRINLCNTKGKVLIRHELSERDGVAAAVADFRNAQEQLGSGYVGASLSSMRLGQMDAGQAKSNIVRYVYERDENGHIIKQTYHANNDYNIQRSIVRDADGIFGRKYTLDSLGRRVRIDYLGLDGEKACTKKGVAGRLIEYDNQGNLVRITYFDLEDHPTFNNEMWATVISEYDENGNSIKELFFGPDGNPCLNTNGVAGAISSCDKYGNIIENTYIGLDGKPCLSNDYIAKWTAKYDRRGNRTEMSYYDTDGKACLSNEFLAKWTAKYDDRGNKIEVAYWGTDGKPCLSDEFCAKWTAKYDDRGNEVEVAYWGTDGKPCLSNEFCAKWTAKYDDRGNKIEVAYWGTDGKPCLSNELCAKWTAKYDDRGNKIEVAYWGKDGKPCFNSGCISRWTACYDDQGNMIQATNYGVDGELCVDKEFVARYEKKYDEKGNLTEIAYYGTDGKPCIDNTYVSKQIYKYDIRGNNTEVANYGTDGKLCIDDKFVAKYISKFDTRGNKIEISHLGTNNMPCLDDEMVSKILLKYDNRGYVTELSHHGINDKPCINHAYGYYRKLIARDEYGNDIKQSFFGVDNSPCFEANGVCVNVSKYDIYGNRIESAYYDTHGKPCISPTEGDAVWRAKYDNHGNRIEISFWDVDGKPCISTDGIFKEITKYDDKNNVIEESFYGIDDSLCIGRLGYAIGKTSYDARGNTIEYSFYGIDGMPCLNYEGIAKQERSYDDRGMMTSVISYGVNGEKCKNNYGFCKYINNYDERGNIKERAFYDERDKPIEFGGYYRYVTNYDALNRVTDIIYYDKDNIEKSHQLSTEIAVYISAGTAIKYGLSSQSILLKWNNWILGNSYDLLILEKKRSRYGEKDLYYLMPDGSIKHIYIQNGPVGVELQPYSVEVSEATEWMKALEQYKKEQED